MGRWSWSSSLPRDESSQRTVVAHFRRWVRAGSLAADRDPWCPGTGFEWSGDERRDAPVPERGGCAPLSAWGRGWLICAVPESGRRACAPSLSVTPVDRFRYTPSRREKGGVLTAGRL